MEQGKVATFSEYISFGIDQIYDIGKYFRSPRKYLSEVLKYSNKELFRKYLVLSILIEGFVLCFIPLLKPGFGINYRIIAVSIFLDLIIGIPLILIFCFVFKIAKLINPFKTALVYVVTAKLFIGVFPIILFLLFIMTESYLWAILRGIIFWGLLIFIIGAPAFIFYKNKRHLFVIFITSILLFIGYMGINLLISSKIEITENQLDILEDPIGQEFYEYHAKSEEITKMGFGEDFIKILKFIDKHGRHDYHSYYQLRDSLINNCVKDMRTIKEVIGEYSKKEFTFQTNTEIFELFKQYFNCLNKYKNCFIELLYTSPLQPEFDEKTNEISKLITDCQQKRMKYMDKTIRYFRLLVGLSKMRMIALKIEE